MKTFRLCYYSATSMEIPSLRAGVERYRNRGGKIDIIARTQSQLSDPSHIQAFVQKALSSHALIITLHGGGDSFPALKDLVEALNRSRNQKAPTPHIHVHPSGSDEEGVRVAKELSSRFGGEEWSTLNSYLRQGGPVNFYGLLAFLAHLVGLEGPPPTRPTKVPDEGLYHPDEPGVPDPEPYFRERLNPDLPTVGLWFHQSYWLNNNLAFVDEIIRETERRGANVIAVFHHRFKDLERGNRGADHVVERFFMDHGHPRIDVLINAMMFSLKLASPDYEGLLERLNVPCIQASSASVRTGNGTGASKVSVPWKFPIPSLNLSSTEP